MAMMLDIAAEVPQRELDDFSRACARYRDELGNRQSVAIRRGVLNLLKSLRARTARAAKTAPASHVTRNASPRYLTPKGHKQKSQKAWAIRRRVGSDRERTYVHAADSRAEARRRFAAYTRFGLARKSWGLVMKCIFNRAIPTEGNPKAKVDSRMGDGFIRESGTKESPRVEVYVHNRLDYIRSALPDAALADSLRAATNSINKQIDAGLARARKELE